MYRDACDQLATLQRDHTPRAKRSLGLNYARTFLSGSGRGLIFTSQMNGTAGIAMKVLGYIGMGLALALASPSALAFQEQGGAAPVAPTPSAPAEAQPAAPAGKNMEFSAPRVEDSDAGTEVRIPGLGKLGVLPKMDFGLELLYGANDTKQPEVIEQQPAEDLTVRGTIKHNF
jgi:hypothetical protein